MQVHVYNCKNVPGTGVTVRQSEQQGILRGRILPSDAEDSMCSAVDFEATPCRYDISSSTLNSGIQVASYWRMKVLHA